MDRGWKPKNWQILPDGRGWLLLILLAYLLVTLAYGAINPLFEAPDEHWHYFTAQYIADNGKLPVIEEAYDEWLSQEAAQPPLYYWLASRLIRLLGVSNPRDDVWLNPFFATAVGDASALANKNLVVHGETWPWQGYVLAGHLLRGLSALFGLGTLLCVYGSGRLLWPHQRQRPLLAVGLLAFLPQFNFVHASISNDVLMTLLASLALWQLVMIWTTAVSWWRLLLLGITVGLAALTKTAGILLLLYVLAVLCLKWWRENGRWPHLAQMLLPIVTLVCLIAGWLWWRNWLLYGDITAANQFVRIAGGDRGYGFWQVLGETPSLWHSLFAVFGWFNVRPPEWVYWVWYGLVALAILGAVWPRSGQEKRLPALMLLWLAGWPLLVYAGLFAFMLRTPAAQGRLLFPALLPLLLGLAYGLSRWRRLMWLGPGLGLLTTLAALWSVGQAYERPSTIDRAMLPADVPLLAVEMGQGITLLAAQMETETAVAGDEIWLTLYWQAQPVPAEPPVLVLELFGQDWQRPLAKLQSYHGSGLYPANLWPEGQIVAERVALRLASDAGQQGPLLAQLFGQLLGVGERQAVLMGEVKLLPTVWPQATGEVLAMVGEGVALTAVGLEPAMAKAGDRVLVQVQWQVMAAPNGDFTTFVHLGEAGQVPLLTGDGMPRNGRYPTSVWVAGEVIQDVYELVLPLDLANGRYPLWLGMYDGQTGNRLPLTIAAERQANDAYLAGWLVVSP